ncbi:hypothetical protein QUF64_10810 [Anaerolineales bacterium HSG6]|nr:hypothetical protein [Anaerolineales bacterium HSG6]
MFRQHARQLILLFSVALVVRLITAYPQQQPNYMDAAYYYVNAVNLAQGRGFVEDFLWHYLNDPDGPPQPSHLYWMPLTSMLAGGSMALFDVSYRAAQVPFVLLSALLAPLTFLVTLQLFQGRKTGQTHAVWFAWLAGLLVVFSGFYLPFWPAIDNFTPFALFGALALFGAYLAMQSPDKAKVVKLRESALPLTPSQGEGELASPPLGGTEGGRDSVSLMPLPDKAGHYLFGAGLAVGLAHLSRADGALLLGVIGLVYLYWGVAYRGEEDSVESPPSDAKLVPKGEEVAPKPRETQVRTTPHLRGAKLLGGVGRNKDLSPLILNLVMLFSGYLLILSPWLLRNWQVTGALLPAGAQTIWLTEYNDLFSYGRDISAQTFFAQGWRQILAGRWLALTINLQRVLAEWLMIFLLPLVLVGGWRLRRHALVQLSGLYALLLFVVMTFLFTFPGMRGGLFHSAGALLPFIYGVAMVGLNDSIVWISARRRGWHASSAKYLFGGALVLFAIALSSFVYYQRVLAGGGWNSADATYPEIAEWVNRQNQTAIIMINNPPAYQYHGGGLSVIIPNETVTTTMQVMARYQVDYLVLDKNHPTPLAELYQPETDYPNLSLVKIFAEGSDNEIYLFEVKY